MYYVYILQNKEDRSLYIGYTARTVYDRLAEHNSGLSRYTNQHGPYELKGYIAFCSKVDAQRFEEYLKSGYGRRFIAMLSR